MPNPWDSLPDSTKKAGGNPWDSLPDSNTQEDDWNSGGDSWESLNSKEALLSDINTASKNRQKEEKKPNSYVEKIRKMAKDREEINANKGWGTRLKEAIGNTPVSPLFVITQGINSAIEPTDSDVRLPSANVASVLKGYSSIPVGISRRLYSHLMPGSAEAKAAGDMANAIDQESWNYDPSVAGEMMGQGFFTAGIPGGPAVSKANTAARWASGAAKGAGYGLSDPGWDIKDEQKYRESSPGAALLGAGMGVAGEYAPEIVGGAKRLSERMKNPKEMLREIMDRTNGNPKDVLKSALEKEKIRRINELDAEFANALAGTENDKPDLSGIQAAIRENLAKLNPQIEQDQVLISRLNAMQARLMEAAPKTGLSRYEQILANAAGNSQTAPDVSIPGLTNWRRVIGQRQQAAFDTAGNPVQVTSSREAGGVVKSIKVAIDKAIEQKNRDAAERLANTRSLWHEKMGPYMPDEAGNDPVGRIIRSSEPDTELANVIGSKSQDRVNRIISASPQEGIEAIQAGILSDAMKFRKKDGPIGLVGALTDEHGELIPAAAAAFQGDDRLALEGAVKIAQIADKLGKASNIGIGVAAAGLTGGAAGAALGAPAVGGGMGMLAGGWAGRKWLPNFTAGGWERLLRNPATKNALKALGSLPADSPEAQKIAQSLLANQSWNE